jgi:ABC-2 type transport system permease protein
VRSGSAAGGTERTATAVGPLRALAELRLRLLWRRLRGRGGIPELVARIAVIAVAVPSGLVLAGLIGAGTYQAARAGLGLRAALPLAGVFFGVWQTWTAVALSLAEQEQLDLRRFLVYPLPPARMFGYGLCASLVGDPFAIFWCLLLAGGFAGAALARPGPWLVLLALVNVAFVAATVALVALLQALLARLLRGRRVRALAVAAVYLGTAALVAWSSGAGHPGLFRGLSSLRAVRWVAFPPALATESARALYAGRITPALAWLAALGVAAAVAAWCAYRLSLAEALSGQEGAPSRGAAAGRGWRLPGRLGPLLEKEAKYLLRHPLTSVLALVVPALAGLVGWKIGPSLPADAGEVVRGLPLLAFALYAHLVTQVFWLNAFGWDRGGARLWFLAPVALEDVVRAKNLAAYALSAALLGASGGVLLAVGGAVPAWALAAALALHLGIAPFFLAAGNLVSILAPRASSHTIQRGGRLSPVSGLAGMAIVSAGASVFAIPALVAIRLDAPWLLAGGWLAMGVAGAGLYRALLPRTGRLLAARREALLDAVAGDED